MPDWELEWATDLLVDELSGTAREIAEIIGVASTIQLLQRYGGTSLYLPKTDALLTPVRDKRICDEYYNSKTHPRELARRYGLTESWVRQILRADYAQRFQLPLFDEELPQTN